MGSFNMPPGVSTNDIPGNDDDEDLVSETTDSDDEVDLKETALNNIIDKVEDLARLVDEGSISQNDVFQELDEIVSELKDYKDIERNDKTT